MTLLSADPAALLPTEAPLQVVTPDGDVAAAPAFPLPSDDVLLDLHRRLVRGRRFDKQATALTKQGRLAVYPSSYGQEACQVGAAAALREQDWLFPTYRDSVCLVSRGIDPVEVLTLLRGDWHSGYDPKATRTAPQCTPLATSLLHAVGLAHAARMKGDDVAVLVLLGDGATSEGDAHEALNVAAVYGAPVVFLVQNNGYAISVPLSKQTKAPTIAHKGVGYGMPGHLVDGNDVVAVHALLRQLLDAARTGGGPALVEALTYRMDAHTNADDATRYRTPDEVEAWRDKDPVDRVERLLEKRGLLDDARRQAVSDEAELEAASLRERLGEDPPLDPHELFQHVYARPRRALQQQAAELAAELEAQS